MKLKRDDACVYTQDKKECSWTLGRSDRSAGNRYEIVAGDKLALNFACRQDAVIMDARVPRVHPMLLHCHNQVTNLIIKPARFTARPQPDAVEDCGLSPDVFFNN